MFRGKLLERRVCIMIENEMNVKFNLGSIIKFLMLNFMIYKYERFLFI